MGGCWCPLSKKQKRENKEKEREEEKKRKQKRGKTWGFPFGLIQESKETIFLGVQASRRRREELEGEFLFVVL